MSKSTKMILTVVLVALVAGALVMISGGDTNDSTDSTATDTATETAATADFANTYDGPDSSLQFSYPDRAEVTTEAGLAKVQILGDGNEPATEVTDGITGWIAAESFGGEASLEAFADSEFEAASETAEEVVSEPAAAEFAGFFGQTFAVRNQLGSVTTYYILESEVENTALVTYYTASGPDAQSYVDAFSDIVATAEVSATAESSGETSDESSAADDDTTADEPDAGGEETMLAQSCSDAGGNWLAEHSECEYISESWCSQEGGEFNECASACRHQPEAEVCTMQCVSTCSF